MGYIMIDIEVRNKIRRLFYVSHFSINAIAETVDVHHETVKNAIESNRFNRKRVTEDPLLPYHDKIRETLETYPRISGKRIFKMISGQGYVGNLRRVRRFIRVIKPKIKARIHQKIQVIPGEQGQMDWAHFGTMPVGQAVRKLYAFIIVLAWSRAIFARFSFDMSAPSLLRLHHYAFQFFRGIPRTIVYDNMKTAVVDRVGSAVRLHPTLLEFSGHYGYEPIISAPYNPQSKGRVERAVRYLRENFFVGRTFNDLDDLNRQVMDWCLSEAMARPWPDNKEKSVGYCFDEERRVLLPLPSAIHLPPNIKHVGTDKYGYVRFDLNFYVVPAEHCKDSLTLMADDDQVRIYSGINLVISHQRSWNKGEKVGEKERQADAKKNRQKTPMAHKFRALKEKIGCKEAFDNLMRRAIDLGQDSHALLRFLLEAQKLYSIDILDRLIRDADQENVVFVADLQRVLGSIIKFEQPDMTLQLPERPEVRDLFIKSHDLNLYDKL